MERITGLVIAIICNMASITYAAEPPISTPIENSGKSYKEIHLSDMSDEDRKVAAKIRKEQKEKGFVQLDSNSFDGYRNLAEYATRIDTPTVVEQYQNLGEIGNMGFILDSVYTYSATGNQITSYFATYQGENGDFLVLEKYDMVNSKARVTRISDMFNVSINRNKGVFVVGKNDTKEEYIAILDWSTKVANYTLKLIFAEKNKIGLSKRDLLKMAAALP